MREFSAPNNCHSWICLLINVYSIFFKALPNIASKPVKNSLLAISFQLRLPRILQCDSGKEFANLIDNLCDECKILRKFSRQRNPKSNCQVERLN